MDRKLIQIEFNPPRESSPCECCGGRTTALTRYVRKDGNAFAVYFARFSDNHPERVVAAAIGLGEWGEGSSPDHRVAFAVELTAGENDYVVSVVDAVQSPWSDAAILGRMLDRAEALGHPLIEDAFHVTTSVVSQRFSEENELLRLEIVV